MPVRADADEIGVEAIRRFTNAGGGVAVLDHVHLGVDAELDRFGRNHLVESREASVTRCARFDHMDEADLAPWREHRKGVRHGLAAVG